MSPSVGALAYELAAGLAERRDILARYGVSIPEFRKLIAEPVFQEMLREAKREFGALSSTPDRVRLKAQMLTELGLTEMWGIVRSLRSPEAARVSAYNAIKNLTGMDRPEEAAPIHRFSLKIVIPPTTSTEPKTVTIEASEPDPAPVLPAGSTAQPSPPMPPPTITFSAAGVGLSR